MNDLFLVVFNKDRQLIGLTRQVIEENKYSTGMITVNSGDEVMIIGMGTTMDRKSSTTERAVLIEENHKLSRKFRATLMNVFDSFDVDQDGLLNQDEMNFYTVASGDSELTDQDWKVYLNSFENRDGGLTMTGFIKVHEMEAIDPEGNAAADLWHSLHCLGYDSQLASVYGCAYDIEACTNRSIRLLPYLQYVTKEHRALCACLESRFQLLFQHPQESVLHGRRGRSNRNAAEMVQNWLLRIVDCKKGRTVLERDLSNDYHQKDEYQNKLPSPSRSTYSSCWLRQWMG